MNQLEKTAADADMAWREAHDALIDAARRVAESRVMGFTELRDAMARYDAASDDLTDTSYQLWKSRQMP
jgi:hypothetical protein